MKKNIELKERLIQNIVENNIKGIDNIIVEGKKLGLTKDMATRAFKNFIGYGVVDRTIHKKTVNTSVKFSNKSNEKVKTAFKGRDFKNIQEAASFILYIMDHAGKSILTNLCLKLRISINYYFKAIRQINFDGKLLGNQILNYKKQIKPARITDAIIAYRNRYGINENIKNQQFRYFAKRNLCKRIGEAQYYVSLASAGAMHNALKKLAKGYDLFK